MGLFRRLSSSINSSGQTLGDINKVATSTKPKPPTPKQEIEVTPEYEEIKRLLDEGSKLVFVTGGAGIPVV